MKALFFPRCDILLASFMIEFLMSGAARLSSVYFVESITRYDADRKEASFPFVLTYLMKNLAGPLIGYLEQILGMRLIILLGCLMGTLGVGGCFFAENIVTITILWGVMLGLGLGFTHQILPSLLNHHFSKNKSMANGFSLSGSCIGGVLLPLIIKSSIESYGVSGSFLILSALLAHSIPASLVLKNPESNLKAAKNNGKKIYHEAKNKNLNKIYNNLEANIKETNKKVSNDALEDLNAKNLFTSNNDMITKELAIDSDALSNQRKAKSYIYERRVSKQEFLHSVFSIKKFAIFFDPIFINLLIIHGLSTYNITSLWTIILDFVRDKGIDSNYEIYFVMILPLSDLVGRFGSGLFIDKSQLNPVTLASTVFTLYGLSYIAIIFVSNGVLLILCEAVISVFGGAIVILQIHLTHELIDEDKRTMAMSCRLILYAPLSLAISPMIGYFRGSKGSYNYIFYILGASSLFCGCLSCIVPYLSKARRKKDKTILCNPSDSTKAVT